MGQSVKAQGLQTARRLQREEALVSAGVCISAGATGFSVGESQALHEGEQISTRKRERLAGLLARQASCWAMRPNRPDMGLGGKSTGQT